MREPQRLSEPPNRLTSLSSSTIRVNSLVRASSSRSPRMPCSLLRAPMQCRTSATCCQKIRLPPRRRVKDPNGSAQFRSVVAYKILLCQLQCLRSEVHSRLHANCLLRVADKCPAITRVQMERNKRRSQASLRRPTYSTNKYLSRRRKARLPSRKVASKRSTASHPLPRRMALKAKNLVKTMPKTNYHRK